MLSLLGSNNRPPLFHMSEHFIWINEKKRCINEFTIGYMINPGLNVNKAIREQVVKYMFSTFGEITYPFIEATLAKNNTRVLALLIFYETRADKTAYIVLSCVIFTIIKVYVCID